MSIPFSILLNIHDYIQFFGIEIHFILCALIHVLILLFASNSFAIHTDLIGFDGDFTEQLEVVQRWRAIVTAQ